MPVSRQDLFRLPYSTLENPTSWLEITSACQMECGACYRDKRSFGHRSLEEIEGDLRVLQRCRNTDVVQVAGGEPLLHPQLPELVKMIRARGWQANILTNGELLTESLLRELDRCGVSCLTFHVDSKQKRTGWEGRTEPELNELRNHFACLVNRFRKRGCGFVSTVYPDTLAYVPEVAAWAHRNCDKVLHVEFVGRGMSLDQERFRFYTGSREVNVSDLCYATRGPGPQPLRVSELYEQLERRFPAIRASGYLNSTADPEEIKWLFIHVILNEEKIYCYAGPVALQLATTYFRLLHGKYKIGTRKAGKRLGKLFFCLLAAFDKGFRRGLIAFLRDALADPRRLLRPLYVQQILLVDPSRLSEDGSSSMCDGCPDMTVWNGKLVHSCRLEEHLRYGQLLRAERRE